MTLKYLSGNRITGVNADTKPTNVTTNSKFFETDTNNTFNFNGSSWSQINGGTGYEELKRVSGQTITNIPEKKYLFITFRQKGSQAGASAWGQNWKFNNDSPSNGKYSYRKDDVYYGNADSTHTSQNSIINGVGYRLSERFTTMYICNFPSWNKLYIMDTMGTDGNNNNSATAHRRQTLWGMWNDTTQQINRIDIYRGGSGAGGGNGGATSDLELVVYGKD